MNPNKTTIKTLLLLLALIPNILFAGYSFDTKYTTNGSSSYNGEKILKLGAYIYRGNQIKFQISKIDGSRFNTSGDIFLKTGTYESYGNNRKEGRILKNYYSKEFKHNLDDYSGYPKKFYGRYQSDNGGWAWVGPITVYKTEDKDTTKPTGSISGFSNIKKGTKLYIKVKANDNKALSTMTLHIQKVGGSVVLSKSWNSSSTSFSQNYNIYTSSWSEGTYNYSYFVKDASGNLKTITGSFKVSDDKDTVNPTGGLTTTIKSSYVKGQGITFGIRANDNKKLKKITLNIATANNPNSPLGSVTKSWSSSSTSFTTVYTANTAYLNVGDYLYTLFVKDDADNVVAVKHGEFSVTASPPPPPTTSISKTLGVRYEQPICFNNTAPTVELKQLTGENAITYNGVKSLSIEFEARVSGGTPSCTDSRGVFHRQHIFTAWKTDVGGFIDKTPSGSSFKYKKVQLIVPLSQKDEYRVLLYVGDNLGKEVRKSYIKSNGRDTDGDGTVDKYDFDDDNDGLTDYQESKYDFLNPLVADAHDDYDKDGISNIDEINKYRTNPKLKDSDGDGVNDKEDKYPNDPSKSDDDKKVGNKWMALKSKPIFSVKEEEVQSKTVANFVIVSYKPKPTTPQAYTIYMQDEKGVKSVVKSGKVMLDQERWLEVKLPVGTKAGVYKVWGTVEVDNKESNTQDNTSKVATITVIGEVKPLELFSTPLYTTKGKISFHVLGEDSGKLVVNGKETNIEVGGLIKKIELDADKEVYELQVKKNNILSDKVTFKLYKKLDIKLKEQTLTSKAKYGSNEGKYLRYYILDTAKDTMLNIDMKADFDTHLAVVDMKLKPLYQNSSGKNSKLSNITLVAGRYYIETASSKKDVKGTFSLDIVEVLDTDKDGIPDSSDLDDDNDGMSDEDELKYGLNPLVNDANGDKDKDGVSNIDEIKAGTYPNNRDSDGDGVDDKEDKYPLDSTKSEDEITIEDEKLLSCVRSSLRLSSTQTPTTKQLEGMKRLYCHRKGLVDENIEEIGKMPNLEYVSLYGNKLTHTDAFSTLTKLYYLQLGSNQLDDLSGLETLDNLRYLFAYYNKITDIDALSSLSKLYYLHLGGNKIKDIQALSELENLKYLYIYKNEIEEISALSSNPKLYVLHIRENKIVDVSPLAELRYLKYLYADKNCLTDFSSLPSHVKVYGKTKQNNIAMCREGVNDVVINDAKLLSCVRSSLRLSGSQTPTTAQLLGLKYLSCRGKGLTNQNIVELKKMPNVETVYFYKSNISNLSYFSELKNLKRLDLNYNKLSSLEGIESLKELEYFSAYRNSISDLTPLKSLKKLRVLQLGYNRKISDVRPLSGLTNMSYLYLYGNNIRDISSLKSLRNLRTLSLSYNKLTDISAITGMRSLRYLYVYGNCIRDFSKLPRGTRVRGNRNQNSTCR